MNFVFDLLKWSEGKVKEYQLSQKKEKDIHIIAAIVGTPKSCRSKPSILSFSYTHQALQQPIQIYSLTHDPLQSRRFWSFNWFTNFQEHLSSLENIWPRRNIHVSFELVKELIEKYYIELERKSKYVLWQIFTFRAEVEARVRGKFQLSKMEYNKYSNMDRIAKENCFCTYENGLAKWRL